jgi:hypothetical protein
MTPTSGAAPAWKFVPVEPTPEIVAAGTAEWENHNHGSPYDSEIPAIYRAMLAAAPPPPAAIAGESDKRALIAKVLTAAQSWRTATLPESSISNDAAVAARDALRDSVYDLAGLARESIDAASAPQPQVSTAPAPAHYGHPDWDHDAAAAALLAPPVDPAIPQGEPNSQPAWRTRLQRLDQQLRERGSHLRGVAWAEGSDSLSQEQRANALADMLEPFLRGDGTPLYFTAEDECLSGAELVALIADLRKKLCAAIPQAVRNGLSDEPWDASQIKQPGWHHVMGAFIAGANEARANPDATGHDFTGAADGYTKRVFEEVDPISEAALRTESWTSLSAASAPIAPTEPTDGQMLDWLEAKTHEGYCPALVFDDDGHWAVMFDGVQSIPVDGHPVVSTFLASSETPWRDTSREAIRAAMAHGGAR